MLRAASSPAPSVPLDGEIKGADAGLRESPERTQFLPEPITQHEVGWAVNGELVSRIAEPDYSGSVFLDLVKGRDGEAIAAWSSWRKGSYAMLLTPHGVAASQRRVERELSARPLVERAGTNTRPALGIRAVEPHPMADGGFIRLALPETAPASLAAFDLAGRCVWSLDVGHLGAGEHRVPFAGGTHVPAGIYLVRLAQGARVVTARVVVLR